jgi:hypothetical protein
MIDRKLQEYIYLLQSLYGGGTQLQRTLALSTTYEEQEYLTSLIEGTRSPNLGSGDTARKSDSVRRAKSRLLEKLDNVILANRPSSSVSRRVEVTRDAFTHAATAAMARRYSSMSLAKHKLQVVARTAVPPDMYEIRLFALRMLVSIAAHDASGADYNRYSKELDRSLSVYNTIIAIDESFRHLILENLRKYKRPKGLQRVAKKALGVLRSIDFTTCDPVLVVTGCTLATAVAQIESDKVLADTWLSAYVDACKALDLWDDAHQRDWLLQQIVICEYFDHQKGFTTYSRQLIKLTKAGTDRWFQLVKSLSVKALRSNNIKLSVQLTMDAVTHPRFRRQRIDIQRSLLNCTGYAAVASGNNQLFLTYSRRRKQRDLWVTHSAVIEAIHALNENDVLGVIASLEHSMILIGTEEHSSSAGNKLKTQIMKVLQQLRKLEKLTTETARQSKLKELKSRMAHQLLPLATRLL